MATPTAIAIHQGSFLTIEAVCRESDSCPAKEFLESLDGRDRRRMEALFSVFADKYPNFSHPEKFKKIEGTKGLFEFKSFQIRMPCFFAKGGRLILTHGCRKKADKLPAGEIETAENLRGEYQRRVGK